MAALDGSCDSLDENTIDHDLLEISKKWEGETFNASMKLCSLIEQLGPFLTSSNLEMRLKGMTTLTDVINKLPNKSINIKEAEHLIIFFCDRLKDHHSIVPQVLKGILTLVCNENFPSEQAAVIARAIFHEVHVPSHLQADRYCVYSIIFKLLQKCLKELQAIGSEFVFEFIQVMEGERDPKCLLLALHTIPIIVSHFDLGAFVEDLFEVFSCYFPVVFNPPENDPHGISRADLCTALQDCFLSTSQFAPFCFPFFLEKLDADVVVAKLDSLSLLGLCFQTYSPVSFKAHLLPVVLAICKEAIEAKNDEVLSKLLDTLAVVFQVTAKSKMELGDQSILIILLTNLYKECEHLLQDSESLQLYPTNKILLKVCATSQAASDWILSKIFPHFLDMFSTSIRILDRQVALDNLCQFIDGAKQFASFEDENNPYKKYQEDLLHLYISALTTGSEQLHQTAMKGIKAVLSVKNMMEKKNLSSIVECILAAATNNKSNTVRTNYADLLTSFSHHYPLEVKHNIVPCLLHEIETVFRETDVMRLNSLLEFVNAASVHPVVMEVVVPKLTSYATNSCNNSVTFCVVTALLQISKNHLQSQQSIHYLFSFCINVLINHCLEIMKTTEKCSEVFDSAVMDCMGMLIQAVVQQLDKSLTSPLVDLLFKCSMEDSLLLGSETRAPLHCLPLSHQYMFVILLRAVFANIKKEIFISENFILALSEESMKLQEERTVLVLVQCISAVLNKITNDIQLVQIVNTITTNLKEVITKEVKTQDKAILMWIWITKAMLIRGYTAVDHLVKQMISFLDNKTHGKLAADGFHTVLSEEPEVLNKACHANRRLLYKQHFFLLTLPQLLSSFNSSDKGRKANYMAAICHQLKFQEKPVLLSEFSTLLPVISQSLYSRDPPLLAAILPNLAEVIELAPHLFENYVHSLVPQLLELASFPESLEIRIMSLKCLKAITKLPHHLILPLRQDVIKRLARSLDDKKRLVRKEAVGARCEWFLVGEPLKPK